MNIDDEITAAKNNLTEMKRAATFAQVELDKLYVERSKQLHGIDVGMIVTSHGAKYLVVAILPNSWREAKPWLTGRKFKKNGEAGERKVTIFSSWEF